MGKSPDGMTAEEVIQQIMDCYPRSEDELGGKDNLRDFVTYVKRTMRVDLELSILTARL